MDEHETTARPSPAFRRVAVRALLVAASILTLLSLVAVFARREALDSSRFADSSAAVLADATVRKAVAGYLVDQLYAHVDVGTELHATLPAQFAPLADPIAAALRAYADRGAADVLGTDAASTTFRTAVFHSHATFLELVDRRAGQVDTVYLQLRPFVLNLADQVGVGALARQELPANAGALPVVDEANVSTVRAWITRVRTASVWLYALSALLYVAAFLLSRDRRRALVGAGAGLVGVGITLLVMRAVGRTIVVDHLLVAGSPYRDAAGRAYSIFTALASSLAWSALATGVAAMAIAWLAGPGTFARWGRALLTPVLVRRPLVGWAAIAAGGVFSVLFSPLHDPSQIAPRLAVGGLVVGGYELIRRRTVAEHPGGGWTLAAVRARLEQLPSSPSALRHAQALHAQGLLTDEQFVTIARQSTDE
ncbi:MAG: hypothetical protein F2663_01430 [Actinobacteria bacterium]|uniref:Unannotated protein n=1 Tax=freshwater metagenome TaxID=449393 RepID=A0A6J6NMD4_9ZZZZ|nr:hypothetical protein [Actinomycetota bacterium]